MPKHPGPPVFHPDHPHNRHPYPFQTSALGSAHPNLPQRHPGKSRSGEDSGMSDSDLSSASPSPLAAGRCFCGREMIGVDGGIYCSIGDCYMPRDF